jgi:hypothetical protein
MVANALTAPKVIRVGITKEDKQIRIINKIFLTRRV